MDHALCSVDQHGHRVTMGDVDHFPYGIDYTQHIGNMGEGDQPDTAFRCLEAAFQFREGNLPVFIDRQDFERGAVAPAGQLPGNQVAVVLRFGEQDTVAGLQVAFRKTGGYQIDGGGRAAGEDYVFPCRGVDEAAYGLTAGFIHFRGVGAQAMDGTVDVAVGFHARTLLQFEYAARPLGGSGVVEIDQRFTVDLSVECGK